MILLMNREIVDCGSQGGSQGGSDDSFDEHLSQIQIEEERQDMTDVSMSPDYFYVNKNNRATSRHLSYLASPPQFESDSNVHQKNHRFRSQNFYPEVWRLQERRRIITLEQNTLSIFSHYDKTFPKHFIRFKLR